MLDRLEESRARWTALQPLPPETEKRVDRSLGARFIAFSNAIEEKNALALEETEVWLENQLTSAGRKVVDFFALDRHRDALASARAKARASTPLTVDLVRGLHFDLTRGLDDGREHGPGQWKTKQNRPTTRRGRTFRYAAPEDVPQLMQDLIAGYETLAAKVTPLEAVTWFSYHFHLIHPFNDSNGRVQRLVASFLLLKAGLRELIIDPADRGEYLDALTACDSTVAVDKLAPLYPGIETKTLVDFYAGCVARTLEDSIDLVEGNAPESPAEVARSAKQQQKALLVRMRQDAPEIAWRQDASAEVRSLFERVKDAMALAKEDGPLYALEPGEPGLHPDHQVDPLLRPFIPAGGAGVVGECTVAIRPHPTSGLKLPAAKALAIAIVASKMGLHVLSRWDHETKPTVRHGAQSAASWSRASLERHLAERIDRARLDFDAQILELNRTKGLKSLKALSTKREKLVNRVATDEEITPVAPRAESKSEARKRPDSKRLGKAKDDKRETRAEREAREAREAREERREKARRRSLEESESSLEGIRPDEPPVSV